MWDWCWRRRGRSSRGSDRDGYAFLTSGAGNLSAAVGSVAQNLLAALRAKKPKFAHGAFLLSFPCLKPSYKRAKPMQHQTGHQTWLGRWTPSTTSIPASGARSKPVQRIMPVNEFVITIVLQKIHAVLDDNGGNQAIRI